MASLVTWLARRAISRALLLGALLVAFDTWHPAQTQPYCAMYNDGSKDCGIPTIESCRESVSGVGGICTPDETSQMRPDFFNQRRLFQQLQGNMPSGPPADSLDQLPPPPDE